MPTQTFFNLQEERQEEIIHAAFEEFALHDYEGASVSNIRKRLGMSSNGTFFRYFKTKLELYAFLMDYASKKRLENVEQLFAEAENFEQLLIQNFYEKVQFDLKYPLYGQFLYNSMQERQAGELGNLLVKTYGRLTQLVQQMMSVFQKKGEIRDDLDPEIMAYSVVRMQMSIYDFLALRHQIDFQAAVITRNPIEHIPQETIMNIVRQFVRVLCDGLKPATI